jgi:hypothetical protein
LLVQKVVLLRFEGDFFMSVNPAGFEPPHYGPYNSSPNPPTITLPLTSSVRGPSQIKEFHEAGPLVTLVMTDNRLPAPYLGQVARNNTDWNFTAIQTLDESGKPSTTGYFSLKTTTLWTTIAYDGSYLMRYGYFLSFCRGAQLLFQHDCPGPDFGKGQGGDVCGASSTPTFPPFQIPNDVFVGMDNVVVFTKPDQFWACG